MTGGVQYSPLYAAGHLLYTVCLSVSAVIHSTAPVYLVTPAAALSLTTLWTRGHVDGHTVARQTGCCYVLCCVSVLPLRDHSNVDCQVPRQPWPLLCRELLCWAWRRVHVYSSTLGTPAPASLISITLFLSTRLPPTILREHHECALK